MRKLKLILGVLMITALFVPLRECSHNGKVPPTKSPPPKTLVQKIFPRSDAQTDYDYGATLLRPSLDGVPPLIAFSWPLVLAFCNRSVAGKRRAWILYAVELLLCAGTIYWIYELTRFGTRLWGAYLVFALAIVYAVAALIDLWTGLQRASPPSGAAS